MRKASRFSSYLPTTKTLPSRANLEKQCIYCYELFLFSHAYPARAGQRAAQRARARVLPRPATL